MSDREYRRRIGAEDLPAENRLYYGFDAERHITPIPESARSIASEMLGCYRPFAGRHPRRATFGMLAGHDPGEICNVTTLSKPYLYRGEIRWYVVDRFITERTTAEQHAARLLDHVRREHGLNYEVGNDPGENAERLLVICDPHGRGESKTDYATVYGAFTAAGLDVFSAAGDEQVIQGKARRDMLNRLFAPSEGAPRLYIARRPTGEAAAPELVEALEQLQLDAEKGRKGPGDKTHHPVSLGYGLWPFEAPAVTEYHRKRTLAELGRAA